jgi:protein gp37
MIFVNSMSDLFHEKVPDEYIEQVCEVMSHTPWHIFQVLTKRSPRLSALLSGRLKKYSKLKHIWWGVSIEDKKHGVPRLRQLQNTPASIRFLSVEPLLEDLGQLELSGISWVIVGGESGPGARSISPEWVRSIRDQCADSAIPFFFKQWGGIRKKEHGRVLDGAVHDEFPKVKRAAVLDPTKRKVLAAKYSLNELVAITC